MGTREMIEGKRGFKREIGKGHGNPGDKLQRHNYI